jgi:hypothetical protein
MNDNAVAVVFVIIIVILVIITSGDPDILDGLIKMANK